MADGKGWPVVMKLAVPPNADYHSGASLIVQGDTLAAVQAQIDEYMGEEVGATLIRDVFNYNLPAAVTRALQLDGKKSGEEEPAKKPAPKKKAPAKKKTTTRTAGARKGSAGGAGSSASTDGATDTSSASDDEPASANLLAVLAKKKGVEINELGELTTAQAKAALKEAKSK
jgi:hypothetical protein